MSITYNQSQQQPSKSFPQKIKIGLKIIFWKIMFWCFVGLSFAVFGKILVVIKNGHAISYKTLTAAVDDLEATEDNEKMIYEQNAYRHYAQTYSSSVAKKIAEKETAAYFDAREKTRQSDLAADNKLVDGMAEETEKGGFLSRLTGSQPLPFSKNQSMAQAQNFDPDLMAMQARPAFKPSLPRVSDLGKFDKCRKLKTKEQKKHGCPPPTNFGFK